MLLLSYNNIGEKELSSSKVSSANQCPDNVETDAQPHVMYQ